MPTLRRRLIPPKVCGRVPRRFGSIFAWLYDIVMAVPERSRIGKLRSDMVSKARGRVLEIGAGTGLNFPYYAPDTLVVALDRDLNMLGRAGSRASAANSAVLLVGADAELLPFPDSSFDEAVVGLAMCTIPHPDRALTELHRTIKLGGSLRLLEHVRLEQPLLGRLQDSLTPVWRRLTGGCRLDRRTAAAVAANGFTIESLRAHFGGYIQVIVARHCELAGDSAAGIERARSLE